jgi:ABC-2 type transport system permease protein
MRTLKAGASLFRLRVTEGLQYRLAALSGSTLAVFWA